MKDLTCAAARHMLEAYHDEELSVREQIAVGAHLERCEDCAAALPGARRCFATSSGSPLRAVRR